MKITLNIDDALLDRVVASSGTKTKTDAIHLALTEMDRRAKLVALLSEDINLTPDEWRNAFDTNALVADDEDPASPHDRKPRPRR